MRAERSSFTKRMTRRNTGVRIATCLIPDRQDDHSNQPSTVASIEPSNSGGDLTTVSPSPCKPGIRSPTDPVSWNVFESFLDVRSSTDTPGDCRRDLGSDPELPLRVPTGPTGGLVFPLPGAESPKILINPRPHDRFQALIENGRKRDRPSATYRLGFRFGGSCPFGASALLWSGPLPSSRKAGSGRDPGRLVS